jgi:Putative aminopeptidase
MGMACGVAPGNRVTDNERVAASMKRRSLLAGLVLVMATGACQTQRQLRAEDAARNAVIAEIKIVQQSLGFEPTRNFLEHAPQTEAFYRCYYTGKLEIPDSYAGLRFREGSREGCAIDESKYDVFFYPIEAVASGKAPVTEALSQASAERLAVVVSHEDFHNQERLKKLPETMHEAAATLVGFLTAAEHARQKSGLDSEQHQRLARDAELFLRKSEIVNAYHAKVSQLYARVQDGAAPEREALAEKAEFFEELGKECLAIDPSPATFNRCPSVLNNAALAFDRTYTTDYPLMHRLYLAQQRDLRATIGVLASFLNEGNVSEQEAEQKLLEIVRRLEANLPPAGLQPPGATGPS